jgi:uncharacterized membrane protein
MMDKNRLEAFSDGVLAIIITIMVLELKQPLGDSLDDLMALWPVLVSYLVSFLFIAIYWVNHHITFHDVEKVNIKILWCNIKWLLTMSFIPFFTAWVGAYPESWTPISLYFLDMFLASATFHVMFYFIVCESGDKENFHLGPRSIISLVTYFLAAVLGGFCPTVSMIVVAVVSCWWFFPDKL